MAIRRLIKEQKRRENNWLPINLEEHTGSLLQQNDLNNTNKKSKISIKAKRKLDRIQWSKKKLMRKQCEHPKNDIKTLRLNKNRCGLSSKIRTKHLAIWSSI